ncbi:hypothetical protein M438DRAFT_337597 [Aureobasidium pullulans EXF-150]|uniref:Zn(2)-C6 fungal-type domain-containing protein n=1 Tax=Aureobasidium pullulans EXF-150 TaxID=1043002 RepID=A0A074XJ72_AURPU|nr:uncharacterized protein M438DRAFT_337597 [Aureobasidium pullulans EXF-150]KEQ82077.1 hypothetical protein M438DRAFT_337597 [Aureobasidium pullulans EXF-150]
MRSPNSRPHYVFLRPALPVTNGIQFSREPALAIPPVDTAPISRNDITPSTSSRRCSVTTSETTPGSLPASTPISLRESPSDSGGSWNTLTPSSTAGTVLETSPPQVEQGPLNKPAVEPTTRVWQPCHRGRGRKKKVPLPLGPKPSVIQRKGPQHGGVRSNPLTDQQRSIAHITRTIVACVNCRFKKGACRPDPIDLADPNNLRPSFVPKSCLGCQRGQELCIRWKMADASLYRKQNAPFQAFSKRWQNMDLVDIVGWASDELRIIDLTQVIVNAPYSVVVRKFVPQDGDMLEEEWSKDGRAQKHAIPPYALANMQSTALMLEGWMTSQVWCYVSGIVFHLDIFIWSTYMEAFRYAGNAQTDDERELIGVAFKLWLACRKTSNPERICGSDCLGVVPVDDTDSPWFKGVPMPPIIIAQMECIMYTKFLRPMSKSVLNRLQKMILSKKKTCWFTTYLVSFILLHSCSMVTRRDYEYARQMSMQSEYANPDSIRDHHKGAEIILTFFHAVNKGSMPFEKILNEAGRQEVAEATQLGPEQIEFVRWTAEWYKSMESYLREVRSRREVRNDLYWVAQLFETDWKAAGTS